MHHVATSKHITGATTIETRFLLGATCAAGTLLIDAGSAPDAAQRMMTVVAAGKELPNFPMVVKLLAGRQKIHCSGGTDAVIHYVEEDQ